MAIDSEIFNWAGKQVNNIRKIMRFNNAQHQKRFPYNVRKNNGRKRIIFQADNSPMGGVITDPSKFWLNGKDLENDFIQDAEFDRIVWKQAQLRLSLIAVQTSVPELKKHQRVNAHIKSFIGTAPVDTKISLLRNITKIPTDGKLENATYGDDIIRMPHDKFGVLFEHGPHAAYPLPYQIFELNIDPGDPVQIKPNASSSFELHYYVLIGKTPIAVKENYLKYGILPLVWYMKVNHIPRRMEFAFKDDTTKILKEVDLRSESAKNILGWDYHPVQDRSRFNIQYNAIFNSFEEALADIRKERWITLHLQTLDGRNNETALRVPAYFHVVNANDRPVNLSGNKIPMNDQNKNLGNFAKYMKNEYNL